jgi:hypothetical protein
MIKLLRKITHMLSCKEVSHLNSQRFERSLTLGERVKIRLHLLACDACARVLKQLRFIHEAMKQYRIGPPPAGRRNVDR